MTNVEKSSIKVTNDTTEQIHRRTTESWNDDDETQFLNPETKTLLPHLIPDPESTTPKQPNWATEGENDDDETQFSNPETSTLPPLIPESTTPKQESWTFESLEVVWNQEDEFWNENDEVWNEKDEFWKNPSGKYFLQEPYFVGPHFSLLASCDI